MTFEEIAQISPFSLPRQEKRRILEARMETLTAWHAARCASYGRVCRCLGGNGAEPAEEVTETAGGKNIGEMMQEISGRDSAGAETQEIGGRDSADAEMQEVGVRDGAGAEMQEVGGRDSADAVTCEAGVRDGAGAKMSGAAGQRRVLEDIPFLPVRMFKDMELCSVPSDAVVKTMTSSGTTGQQVSRIYLDRATAANQQKAMVKIVSDFTGRGRLPMLIIDSPAVVKNRRMFSARGAGILGFSILASDRQYALREDMSIDMEGIAAFLEKHAGKRILLFGFTFMIWQYFCRALEESGQQLSLEQGILIHGGGWKKLKNEAVEPDEFRERLQRACGIREVHDYYGMVEQTGCIYMECEYGHLHASIFSDVITRRMKDFSPCDVGEEGVLQVLSVIPESYPGHSILTEDQGIILGEDDCPCGRLGKYFRITGRMKEAEIRGCSDTFEEKNGKQITK